MNLLERLIAYFIPDSEVAPLLQVAAVLIAGALGGHLARLVKLPAVTGYIAGGILVGPSCLGVFAGYRDLDRLEPLATFAMGMITVVVGRHLCYRRIHNALKRIILISICEVSITFFLVAVLLHCFFPWPVALLLGAISTSTAPATTIALIRERRAKGPFVKTLVTVVALDNILCILLFAVVRAFVTGQQGVVEGSVMSTALFLAGVNLVGSLGLGLLIGWTTAQLIRLTRAHDFSIVFFAVLFCAGFSEYEHLSPLLSCLFLGVYLGNSRKFHEDQLNVLEPIQPLLFVCFFALAGASLHLSQLADLTLLAMVAVYFVARVMGKGFGSLLGGLLAGARSRIWSNMPLGLVPQAGVAIGLVVLLEGDARLGDLGGNVEKLVAIVLAAVTIAELVGPLTVNLALRGAREVNLDRPRLMEFLQEEFIRTGMRAADKWEAIRELTDFLIRTHRVDRNRREDIHQSIVRRERDSTTAIGGYAAIPHGRIDAGPGIVGVLGICREGIAWDAPDGAPVQIIMLIATPRDHDQQHLEVMAGLAKMVADQTIRSRLIAAVSPHDAWEVIEHEEVRDYNYFIEAG